MSTILLGIGTSDTEFLPLAHRLHCKYSTVLSVNQAELSQDFTQL